MTHTTAAEIQARVIGMYEQHPFPSVEDKAAKTENEMPLRLALLGVKPEEYVGKNVLDAGCGTGEYSAWYARRGARVTAVDLSRPSLRIAEEYARGRGLDNIEFREASVLALPYPDRSFDYVYTMGVLHHTPDPYGGFRELCRVLKPGGVITVSVYNKFGRFRHNLKQAVVNRVAGTDIDRRVTIAKRFFPGTCRALKRSRGDDSDVILYDAFGIPHESQHSAGELLGWFKRNQIEYLGAFGPMTIADNLKALRMIREHPDFKDFPGFVKGFRFAEYALNRLPRIVSRFGRSPDPNKLRFSRPSWLSRASVQFVWLCLGFRFSIFTLAGRRAGQ